ncbi:MAG: hypothetical protein IPI67_34055 [Myxococcales bacterium]|nr:hypothetical protein [Myxococcales bacterium]
MSDRDEDERPSAEAAGEDERAEAAGEDTSAPDAAENDDESPELDEAAESKLRDLLRGSLGDAKEEPPPESEFLRGVQKRLRDRSGGKFYDEGWSTARHPPTYTYLWTSVLMLAIVLAVYATLTSLVGEAAEVENQPAPVPVQIIFPKDR